jgi:beta-alanine degradation protein BauB
VDIESFGKRGGRSRSRGDLRLQRSVTGLAEGKSGPPRRLGPPAEVYGAKGVTWPDKIGRMNISLTRAAIVLAAVLIPCTMLTSQQTSQAQRIPQFENQDVKVWKTTVMPNAPLAMHTHDHPRVIVALSGGTMKVVNEDGTSEMHQWETGKAYFLSLAEGKKRHADANQGDKPIEVMVVELKNAK